MNLYKENDKYYQEIIVHRFNVPISLWGKYYLLTGSTFQELNGPALNEFILRRTKKTLDDIPEPKASIGDSDLKFHEVIEGYLIQFKDQIGELINAKFFIHPIDFKGMQRVEKDEYPVGAVREMILNAFVHKS